MKKFYENIQDCVKLIPFGRVTTFKEIAKTCGHPTLSRIVVLEIKKGRDLDNTPYHRVVSSLGKLNNNYPKGKKFQKNMLLNEGIQIQKDKINLKEYGFYFW